MFDNSGVFVNLCLKKYVKDIIIIGFSGFIFSMKIFFRYLFAVLLACAVLRGTIAAQGQSPLRVLIIFEGSDTPMNYARGDARILATLLGHFAVDYKFEGTQSYKTGEVNDFDRIFVVGFSKKFDPPDKVLKDLYATSRQVIWLNTGFDRYCQRFDVAGKYGFKFVTLDTVSNFSVVRAGGRTYAKGEPNLNIITLTRPKDVQALAKAWSLGRRREECYIVRSGNLWYVGDSPFASAENADRYIYFADLLHDILGQDHPVNHRALLRIEDVNVFEHPDKLRAIADLLSARNIPFLVGVIPFFVDPESDPQNPMHVSMSDKPEFVDALHYMIAHGATIVMHGKTHQYHGVTAVDFEFWDGDRDKPIRGDSKDYVETKLRQGLDEFWKNSVYPLIWETPHYTASQLDYSVFAEFFSTAMEQRMVMDDPDWSQYMPYIIERDLHGQKIIPENLGYIPLSDTGDVEQAAVQALIDGARAELGVRDGFASAFIHPSIDLKYMEEYIDSVEAMGYTFMNVKDEQSIVRLKDRVILAGSQSYTITLDDQYLREVWFKDGEVDHQQISTVRFNGPTQRTAEIPPGMLYIAEPSEYHGAEQTFFETITARIKNFWESLTEDEETFSEIRAGVRWDPHATGSGLNDQASYIAAFRSLNVPVDTLDDDTLESLDGYNLVVIPYNTVEHLTNAEYDKIVQFVEHGGNVITDGKNDLAAELGVKFLGSTLRIERMRDQLFPEDPLWIRDPEIMCRFDAERSDRVLCADERTDAPVVIGRRKGDGNFIFFGLRFDPMSAGGYSRFPYLMEYVQRFLRLRPYFRRENIEMYFEPGFRRSVSEENLVKRWVENGVRRIHVAGWHEYPKYTYPYDKLISLCHANGILVYLWLEPPMVSQKFWNEHPAWREVNYKGEAISPAWRYVMAFTNPQCLDSAKAIYRDLLRSYDWDGVNLAELYFESANGPSDPRTLNPMNAAAREDFRRRAGFDPVALVDSGSGLYWKRNPFAWKKFEDYRVDAITRLHDDLLTLIDSVKLSKPDLDVVVTTMDNIGNPELRKNIGVDVRRIAALRSHHDFLLQIQDPANRWSEDPGRYLHLAQTYASLVPDSGALMLDLNILSIRTEDKPTKFPTMIQTGIESYELIRSAALGANRFTIYSESSVRPQDMRMLGYAASARASIDQTDDGWDIATPFPLVAEMPKSIAMLELSPGRRLYSDDGRFYLPPGTYSLRIVRQAGSPFAQLPAGGKLFSITGTLKDVSTSSRSITFSYASRTRCIACFNHPPYNILVDGSDIPFTAMEGYKRFSVMLPSGQHTVIAVLETNVSYGVDLTSFWSSWVIVIFGFLAGAALVAFYLIVRVSRPPAPSV